jgi:DNA-binding LytR/AlgR family response regulator
MRILIIEDEPQAAQRLSTLVLELVPGAEILAKVDSVKKSVDWFSKNVQPDLILMDIQLADGLSFEIFQDVEVKAPVIFTTAYDEYALKAFKVNSIDYILKPVDKEELRKAIEKLRGLKKPDGDSNIALKNIQEAVRLLTKKFKTRFVIKVGEHLRTVEVSAIRFFYSQEKTTFAVTDDNRQHILDFTLEELEDMLDPSDFFRINRKYFVSATSIQDIINYSNSRLRLVLKNCTDNDVIVARERVQEFKSWLDR